MDCYGLLWVVDSAAGSLFQISKQRWSIQQPIMGKHSTMHNNATWLCLPFLQLYMARTQNGKLGSMKKTHLQHPGKTIRSGGVPILNTDPGTYSLKEDEVIESGDPDDVT